jgi:hypothetical protein
MSARERSRALRKAGYRRFTVHVPPVVHQALTRYAELRRIDAEILLASTMSIRLQEDLDLIRSLKNPETGHYEDVAVEGPIALWERGT